MPWRLIGFILIFFIFLVFIVLNLSPESKCNINFGFTVVEDVPVFFTIFTSFSLGFLIALPIALLSKKKQKSVSEKDKKDDKPKSDESSFQQNAAVAEEYNEPAPSYSGGKYFDKLKFKKKK